jgi:hypothetical protein
LVAESTTHGTSRVGSKIDIGTSLIHNFRTGPVDDDVTRSSLYIPGYCYSAGGRRISAWQSVTGG